MTIASRPNPQAGLLSASIPTGRKLLSEECVVCVPARNEAGRIPGLIEALDRQRGLEGGRLRAVLLINNSTDGSAHVTRRAARAAANIDLRIFERRFLPGQAHAGSARRAAMEAGAAWLERDNRSRGVLLTTDADAVPDPDWVARSGAVLGAGADVAAAILVYDPREMARYPVSLRAALADVRTAQTLAVRLEAELDPVPRDPEPRHWDHSGGGLALGLRTYRAVGGCPALPFREDVALVDAVRRAGGIVRHCPSIRVTVSARERGRAAGGMADTIRAWSRNVAEGAAILVPDPQAQEAHWLARASVRSELVQNTRGLAPGLTARRVAAEIARRCPDPVDWPRQVAVADAIVHLERRLRLLQDLRSAA